MNTLAESSNKPGKESWSHLSDNYKPLDSFITNKVLIFIINPADTKQFNKRDHNALHTYQENTSNTNDSRMPEDVKRDKKKSTILFFCSN